MENTWGKTTKWNAARNLLYHIADSLAELSNVQMGLRLYGHQFSEVFSNCKDTKLEVPFGADNRKLLHKKLNAITPQGITPLALSIERGANDFPKTPGRNIMIIITDGLESCGGDPCATAAILQKNHVLLKPFIVGMGIPVELVNENLDCIGIYRDASTPEAFEQSVSQLLSTLLSGTTAEVDLLDEGGRATETNVNMTFYEQEHNQAKYDFYHQMNLRGVPDTLSLDPVDKYLIDIHTIPSLSIGPVSLKNNTHNTFSVKAPQGTLRVEWNKKETLPILVRQATSSSTLFVQSVNSSLRYLSGEYNATVLSLPRITLKANLSEAQTKTFNIPAAGTLEMTHIGEIYGGVFYLQNGSWVKLYEIKQKSTSDVLDLQPGNYKVIYRHKEQKKMKQTQVKDFSITSGQITRISI
jgi:Ca-activated chloride channel family protein